MVHARCAIVVLISGSGSNLQALIDDSAAADAGYEISAVIANNPDAYGLQRAASANIPTGVVNHRDFDSREAFDQALAAAVESYHPKLVVLAGFMRILTREFVSRFSGRMVNIHPSLLPKFPGINTHQRALDAGETEHGVSVHFVTEDLDGGPIIDQESVPILPGDDAAALQQRVLAIEHIIYPRVVRWFAAKRLRMEDNHAILDGKPLAIGTNRG
ncbi:MAG: phosphoribosylglycinamide formyltransferase [Gammaproteobacteria bacterium]